MMPCREVKVQEVGKCPRFSALNNNIHSFCHMQLGGMTAYPVHSHADWLASHAYSAARIA